MREALIGDTLTYQVRGDGLLDHIFLKHGGDPVTDKWGMDTRYIKRKVNMRCATMTMNGNLLFDAYQQTWVPGGKLSADFDEDLFRRCEAEGQDRFLAKGSQTLINIAGRADPEWRDEVMEIFTKAQSITKPGKDGSDAKAPQLIMSFNRAVNARFSPYAKYYTHKLREILPASVYLHNGMTEDDVAVWVRECWDFAVRSTEDDYTAYDQSQDESFLHLDILMFQALNMPQHFIDDHVWLMTHCRSWAGPCAVGVKSGEQLTWARNSHHSLAYQALKYRIRPGTPIMISGDDVALNSTPHERAGWAALSPGFRLISKRFTSMTPDFCGARITPAGPVKLPWTMLCRIYHQIGKKGLFAALSSYALDVARLTATWDESSPCFSDAELQTHSTSVRILTMAMQQARIPVHSIDGLVPLDGSL